MDVDTVSPSADTELPSNLPDLARVRPGAVFLRADLQVHTPLDPAFPPRPQPSDPSSRMELARRYLGAAKERGIELLGITEHNDVSWIDELRRAAKEVGLHLLPGFEVESAEGVHVLCLFDPETSVSRLEEVLVGLGLTRSKREKQRLELRTTQHFGDLLEFIQGDAGGICVAAHIESDKGLLAALRQGARVDVWKTEALLAAQTAKPPAEITSGNGRIVRGEDPTYERQRLPAYVLTSDCRSIEAIGTVSTWIKMDSVGVSGLRQAFLDPESRIAYEDPAERREGARLLAVAWDGDFLSGVRFPLNSELNCLIGGRGTGKSTVIESIRYAFDLGFRSEDQDVVRAAEELRENAFRSGSKISVLVETESPARTRYIVERTAPHAPVVREYDGRPRPDLDAKSLVAPCIYGQKEIYGIAQNARARLEMLDGFAADDLRHVREREHELLDHIRDNGELILATRRRIDDAESKLADLPGLEEWRSRFREAGFEGLLRERRLLDREQRLLDAADKGLVERDRKLAGIDGSEQPLASAIGGREGDTLPNASIVDDAERVLDEADRAWDESVRLLRGHLNDARRRLADLRSKWDDQRAARQSEFDAALRDLQAKMPDVDPERYLDVERRIEQLTPLREAIAQLQERLSAAYVSRAELLVELADARGEKHRVRQRATERLNKSLAGSLRVELTYQAERDAFLARLSSLKTGTRANVLQALVNDPTFSPSEFVRHLREGTLVGAWGTPPGQAATLERALGEETLIELEALELSDGVELLLDVNVAGETRDYRPLSRLSPGQKSTAILLLVLQESNAPLLIDQPEDDLDNRFIYDDIVMRLKRAKPARQFLIATHNANIPVLGDAEQIIALDAREQPGEGHVSAFLRARGSIDAREVRTAAEQILEGGREAFFLRQAKYQA
jgi:PHP family Zn ribbon phosphoesterase